MDQSQNFEKAIDSFSDEIKELAWHTRELIYTILPEVVEVVWMKQRIIGYGTGMKKMTEHFCGLMPAINHVTLSFNYGTELFDPTKLLEGTGKLFRHVKVRALGDLQNPDLHKLIKFATIYRVPVIK